MSGWETARNKLKLYIPLLMLFLAILACSIDENLGTVSPTVVTRCSPVSFNLKGETDHVWAVNVESGVQYEVIVTVVDLDTEHPANQIRILAMYERHNIANEVVYNNQTAKTAFIGPVDGDITIRVSSMIGEYQTDFGVHTITVCEEE